MRQTLCYRRITMFSFVIRYDQSTTKDLVCVEFSLRILHHIAFQFENGPYQVNLNYIRPDNIETTAEYDILS